MSIPHSDQFNIEDGFTIEAWIFAVEWQDAIWQGSILAKDGQDNDRGYAFRCGSNGSLSFVIQIDNVWEEAQSPEIMNANQWHHVAGVFANGTIILYIDGQLSGSKTVGGNATHSPDLPLHVGGSPGFGDRHFNGVIDELRVWTQARTPEQIADNITSDLNGDEEGLALYLPMNEGAGSEVFDNAGAPDNAQFNFMDDSNWVDGFTLPEFDISIQRVFGVDVVNMIDRPVKLKASVQNTGAQSIGDVSLSAFVNGELYTTEIVEASIAPGDLYTHEFALPLDLSGFENPEIAVSVAHPDDGNLLNNEKLININTGSSNKVIVTDQLFHNVGNISKSVNMTLPNDFHRYEQILLNIDLTCPSGGCGDWDVLADLVLVTESGSYEIGRYITPFGIACGGWVIDVTDFKSVLSGDISFTSSVLVFTQTGWLVDMSLDLFDTSDNDSFSAIETLWERSNHVYGDPNIEDDLPALAVDVRDNTTSSHVRLHVTGHGQGNTSNAAEFFEVTNTLEANGQAIDSHHLWNDDCPDNPCANQEGTWLFPRAGWCPGEQVDPYLVNTTTVADAGSTVVLDYELQDYTNLLNTGYNNSGHTEPFYRILSYFIQESDVPYETYNNLSSSNLEATINGNTLTAINVDITNSGFEDIDEYELRIFAAGSLVATESFQETLDAGAEATQNVSLSAPLSGGLNNIFVEVFTPIDNNPGDNVSKAEVSTSINELVRTHSFDVFPNPTGDGLIQIQYDNFWKGSALQIFSTSGKMLEEMFLDGDHVSLDLNQGVYWFTLIHPDRGSVYTEKIISFK